MAKDCVNHAGTAAIAACIRCQKPLCRSCAVVTPTGTYCSPDCKMAARDEKAGTAKAKGGGAGKVLMAIVLLGVASLFLVHLIVRNRPEGDAWKKIDVIGQLLHRK